METMPRTRSFVIYLALMGYLVLVKVALDLGLVEAVLPAQLAFFGWPMIGFLTVVGGCALWLAPRTGLPDLWSPDISPRSRLLLPAVVGLTLGTLNLAVQGLTGFVHVIARTANIPSINVAFPQSILFYSGGAIVVESLYRLILITLPLWLIANVILRKRGRAPVFWAVALLTSLVESQGQVSLASGRLDVMLVLGAGMYAVNIIEAFLFWRYGFLAPLVHRLAFYFVWHVIGGAIGL